MQPIRQHLWSPRAVPDHGAPGPAADLGQALAAAAGGWSGRTGGGLLTEEMLRTRLLLAHCSNILLALLPAYTAAALHPELLDSLPPFPPQDYAGVSDGGRPSAALSSAANHGHPFHPAARMPEAPPSVGPLLAPLHALTTELLAATGDTKVARCGGWP